ncbi:dehydratase [Alcanivorax sp. N3-2A]|nr:dehydratase [Alcanivorax sp. N3-2A]|tara:strand:- start:38954 stop:39397 length:444 start_codon:yes stop_codon:yes gene_type:complete
MKQLKLADLRVGMVLPELTAGPVSRLDLALYCGASGDHNPIHVDTDFARRAGMDDVFAHGMLSMAWLGRLLTQWVPQSTIRRFQVRFAAITRVGEVIHCAGEVRELQQADGHWLATLALVTRNQQGETKISGEAVLCLPISDREKEQ